MKYAAITIMTLSEEVEIRVEGNEISVVAEDNQQLMAALRSLRSGASEAIYLLQTEPTMKRYRLFCADGTELFKEPISAAALNNELEAILTDEFESYVGCGPHRVETVEE